GGLARAGRHAGLGLASPGLERAPDALERDPAVHELRALVRRDPHDAGRPVRHAHRGFGLVAVLASRARAAERLHVAFLKQPLEMGGEGHAPSLRQPGAGARARAAPATVAWDRWAS